MCCIPWSRLQVRYLNPITIRRSRMLQGDSVNGPRADAKEMYGKGKADGMDRWYLDVRWYDLGGGGICGGSLAVKVWCTTLELSRKSDRRAPPPRGDLQFRDWPARRKIYGGNWNRAKAADGRYHTWGVTILRFVSNLQHLGKSPFVAIMNVMILTMRFRKSGRVFRQA